MSFRDWAAMPHEAGTSGDHPQRASYGVSEADVSQREVNLVEVAGSGLDLEIAA